jgi:hypothetical protein
MTLGTLQCTTCGTVRQGGGVTCPQCGGVGAINPDAIPVKDRPPRPSLSRHGQRASVTERQDEAAAPDEDQILRAILESQLAIVRIMQDEERERKQAMNVRTQMARDLNAIKWTNRGLLILVGLPAIAFALARLFG